jgi:hypothetical protein
VADDPELRAHILEALDTQIECEMPLAYHLVDIARSILRIGKRRDAAAKIPRPDGVYVKPRDKDTPPAGFSRTTWNLHKERELKITWWPKFYQHSMLTVANRNVHTHQASCLVGKRGVTGCRFCAPWGHDVDMTRCIELFIKERDNRIQYRCHECYADGAMSDASLTEEARVLQLLEQDHKRDLYYTAEDPTNRCELGMDVRALAVDFKRRNLPTLHRIKRALADGDSQEAIIDLRRVLLATLTEDEELSQLLLDPSLRVLRNRLMELTKEPIQGTSHNKVAHMPNLYT